MLVGDHGDFTSYGGTHSAGLLMAWSWGESGMIDVLQQSGGAIIKHETARTGDILVGSGGSLNMSDWKDWTASTLADDLSANCVLKQ